MYREETAKDNSLTNPLNLFSQNILNTHTCPISQISNDYVYAYKILPDGGKFYSIKFSKFH